MKFSVKPALLAPVLFLAACVSNPRIDPDFTPPEAPARIVIIEPDVQLGLLTLGGMFERRADWSDTAEAHLIAAIRAELDSLGHEGVVVELGGPNDPLHQITLLHSAVAGSAVFHGAGATGPMVLPTKSDGWDWTLGPGAAALGEAQNGDLGLFLSARGSFASGTRLATSILLGAAAGGAYVATGAERLTVASLVDLETGDLVWIGEFPSGDPRTAGGAKMIVSGLLHDAPLTP